MNDESQRLGLLPPPMHVRKASVAVDISVALEGISGRVCGFVEICANTAYY